VVQREILQEILRRRQELGCAGVCITHDLPMLREISDRFAVMRHGESVALALDPELMIMDEPTTALDVVVQREILQEILRLRQELGFAVVFITHDLPMLLEISDRIAVMRHGEIVELDTAENLYFAPQHPYTRRLLGSFPSLTGSTGDFVRAGYSPEETR
jgi:peptide/nickel transport system ATP-binding protein